MNKTHILLGENRLKENEMNEYLYEIEGKEITTLDRMEIPSGTKYQQFFDGVYVGTFEAGRTIGDDFYAFQAHE
jgi:hypothetical protein